jgi:cytoskeletal protein RodZ
MKEEMKKIGTFLKQRRQEMNISLKEAENATSIRSNYLQLIEEGEMAKIISPVYAQGFIKQYAGFLGVEGERIIKEAPELFSRMPLQEFSYGIGTLETRGNPGSGIKWFPNALAIGGLLLVVVIAWLFARFLGVI